MTGGHFTFLTADKLKLAQSIVSSITTLLLLTLGELIERRTVEGPQVKVVFKT